MEGYLPVYKVVLVREREEYYGSAESDDAAAEILKAYFDGADREYFAAMLLDTKNNVVGISTISVGCLDRAIAHPREVFKPAILANAARIIIAHNHPSGDPTPSKEDITMTKQIAEAGEIIGIPVLDSIVVGYKGHFSMHAAGMI